MTCRIMSSSEQGKSIKPKWNDRFLKTVLFALCSVKQLFETADRMYIMPPHRFTVYSMGIGLGYILRMCKDFRFTKSQLKIGWYLSIASFLLAFFGPAPMGDIDYQFNSTHAAHYAAFAPIAWCLFFGWIILVSQLGHKSESLSTKKIWSLNVWITF